MRKQYLLSLLFVFLFIAAKSEIRIVEVTNFQFSPSNIPNVVVGDVIRFQFVQGFHNATSNGVSNATPAGAAPINSGNPSAVNPRTYEYTVTEAGEYKYICEAHADPSSFTGMVGTFTASAALPATIKSFTMTTSTDKKPIFTWISLTEENVSHFSLRRSFDGSTYKEAGKVAAVGHSQTEQFYTYTDNSIDEKNKYVYYMLATVDKDGKEKLLQVKVFKNPVSSSKLITAIGPNPITRPGQLMVRFNSEKAGKMLTRVFDASGKKVHEAYMTSFAGLNSGHIHVCDLNAGTYTIEFSLDGMKETRKMVVY